MLVTPGTGDMSNAVVNEKRVRIMSANNCAVCTVMWIHCLSLKLTATTNQIKKLLFLVLALNPALSFSISHVNIYSTIKLCRTNTKIIYL